MLYFQYTGERHPHLASVFDALLDVEHRVSCTHLLHILQQTVNLILKLDIGKHMLKWLAGQHRLL